MDVLNKGVTSLGFIIKGDDVTAENIAALLDGICPECVELNFNTCLCKAEKLIGILVEYFASKGVDASKCVGSVNYDPFKKPLIKGKKNENWVETASAVLKAGKALPKYKVLAVNAFELNNAGAYISQELGYALAWGNELLAKLTDAGFSLMKSLKLLNSTSVSALTTSWKSLSSVLLVGCGLKSLLLINLLVTVLAKWLFMLRLHSGT